MKFNLARCSKKLVFGSDSNFPYGFFFAVLVVPGIARGWSSSSKIDGFGSGHFHGCLYQGVQKQGICGLPHVNQLEVSCVMKFNGVFQTVKSLEVSQKFVLVTKDFKYFNESSRDDDGGIIGDILESDWFLHFENYCRRCLKWIHSKEDVQRWRLLSWIQNRSE